MQQTDDVPGDGSERATGEILVVDDELALTIVTVELLKLNGWNALPVNTANDALEMVRSAPARFSLMITDQSMPGMSGLELIREVRKIRPDLPVILCTGYENLDGLGDGAAMDISLFEKPVDIELFLRRIEQLLKGDD